MKVVEIFQSIDGEAIRAGQPTNFIRLAHCNLKCVYCDTCYAQEYNQGTDMKVEEILEALNEGIKNVTLTGGEPLLHTAQATELLTALTTEGYNVSVETNGSIPLRQYMREFPKVSFIMDYKLPSSYMESLMVIQNFLYLRPIDAIKFVIGNEEDLYVMEMIYNTTGLKEKGIPIYLSPVFGAIEPKELVEYVLKRELYDVRVQVQLHKIIWEPSKRGV